MGEVVNEKAMHDVVNEKAMTLLMRKLCMFRGGEYIGISLFPLNIDVKLKPG